MTNWQDEYYGYTQQNLDSTNSRFFKNTNIAQFNQIEYSDNKHIENIQQPISEKVLSKQKFFNNKQNYGTCPESQYYFQQSFDHKQQYFQDFTTGGASQEQLSRNNFFQNQEYKSDKNNQQLSRYQIENMSEQHIKELAGLSQPQILQKQQELNQKLNIQGNFVQEIQDLQQNKEEQQKSPLFQLYQFQLPTENQNISKQNKDWTSYNTSTQKQGRLKDISKANISQNQVNFESIFQNCLEIGRQGGQELDYQQNIHNKSDITLLLEQQVGQVGQFEKRFQPLQKVIQQQNYEKQVHNEDMLVFCKAQWRQHLQNLIIERQGLRPSKSDSSVNLGKKQQKSQTSSYQTDQQDQVFQQVQQFDDDMSVVVQDNTRNSSQPSQSNTAQNLSYQQDCTSQGHESRISGNDNLGIHQEQNLQMAGKGVERSQSETSYYQIHKDQQYNLETEAFINNLLYKSLHICNNRQQTQNNVPKQVEPQNSEQYKQQGEQFNKQRPYLERKGSSSSSEQNSDKVQTANKNEYAQNINELLSQVKQKQLERGIMGGGNVYSDRQLFKLFQEFSKSDFDLKNSLGRLSIGEDNKNLLTLVKEQDTDRQKRTDSNQNKTIFGESSVIQNKQSSEKIEKAFDRTKENQGNRQYDIQLPQQSNNIQQQQQQLVAQNDLLQYYLGKQQQEITLKEQTQKQNQLSQQIQQFQQQLELFQIYDLYQQKLQDISVLQERSQEVQGSTFQEQQRQKERLKTSQQNLIYAYEQIQLLSNIQNLSYKIRNDCGTQANDRGTQNNSEKRQVPGSSQHLRANYQKLRGNSNQASYQEQFNSLQEQRKRTHLQVKQREAQVAERKQVAELKTEADKKAPKKKGKHKKLRRVQGDCDESQIVEPQFRESLIDINRDDTGNPSFTSTVRQKYNNFPQQIKLTQQSARSQQQEQKINSKNGSGNTSMHSSPLNSRKYEKDQVQDQKLLQQQSQVNIQPLGQNNDYQRVLQQNLNSNVENFQQQGFQSYQTVGQDSRQQLNEQAQDRLNEIWKDLYDSNQLDDEPITKHQQKIELQSSQKQQFDSVDQQYYSQSLERQQSSNQEDAIKSSESKLELIEKSISQMQLQQKSLSKSTDLHNVRDMNSSINTLLDNKVSFDDILKKYGGFMNRHTYPYHSQNSKSKGGKFLENSKKDKKQQQQQQQQFPNRHQQCEEAIMQLFSVASKIKKEPSIYKEALQSTYLLKPKYQDKVQQIQGTKSKQRFIQASYPQGFVNKESLMESSMEEEEVGESDGGPPQEVHQGDNRKMSYRSLGDRNITTQVQYNLLDNYIQRQQYELEDQIRQEFKNQAQERKNRQEVQNQSQINKVPSKSEQRQSTKPKSIYSKLKNWNRPKQNEQSKIDRSFSCYKSYVNSEVTRSRSSGKIYDEKDNNGSKTERSSRVSPDQVRDLDLKKSETQSNRSQNQTPDSSVSKHLKRLFSHGLKVGNETEKSPGQEAAQKEQNRLNNQPLTFSQLAPEVKTQDENVGLQQAKNSKSSENLGVEKTTIQNLNKKDDRHVDASFTYNNALVSNDVVSNDVSDNAQVNNYSFLQPQQAQQTVAGIQAPKLTSQGREVLFTGVSECFNKIQSGVLTENFNSIVNDSKFSFQNLNSDFSQNQHLTLDTVPTNTSDQKHDNLDVLLQCQNISELVEKCSSLDNAPGGGDATLPNDQRTASARNSNEVTAVVQTTNQDKNQVNFKQENVFNAAKNCDGVNISGDQETHGIQNLKSTDKSSSDIPNNRLKTGFQAGFKMTDQGYFQPFTQQSVPQSWITQQNQPINGSKDDVKSTGVVKNEGTSQTQKPVVTRGRIRTSSRQSQRNRGERSQFGGQQSQSVASILATQTSEVLGKDMSSNSGSMIMSQKPTKNQVGKAVLVQEMESNEWKEGNILQINEDTCMVQVEFSDHRKIWVCPAIEQVKLKCDSYREQNQCEGIGQMNQFIETCLIVFDQEAKDVSQEKQVCSSQFAYAKQMLDYYLEFRISQSEKEQLQLRLKKYQKELKERLQSLDCQKQLSYIIHRENQVKRKGHPPESEVSSGSKKYKIKNQVVQSAEDFDIPQELIQLSSSLKRTWSDKLNTLFHHGSLL